MIAITLHRVLISALFPATNSGRSLIWRDQAIVLETSSSIFPTQIKFNHYVSELELKESTQAKSKSLQDVNSDDLELCKVGNLYHQ